MSQMKSLYRVSLPETCIEFSSPKGKEYFKQALASGYMEAFFPLIEQFHTQNDPTCLNLCYKFVLNNFLLFTVCGLGTLSMILNAFGMDPNRLWKGIWRWYSEELLDCCVPIELIKKKGITIPEFTCLAHCNGLESTVIQYFPIENASPEVEEHRRKEAIDQFRNFVKRSCKQETKEFIVLSYDRKKLGQTGSGHFSPIGGYLESEDKVLILDVARFKYSPHWVNLELVWEAFSSLDSETKKPRGYIILNKPTLDKQTSSILFALISFFVNNSIKMDCNCERRITSLIDSKKWLPTIQEMKESMHFLTTESLIFEFVDKVFNSFIRKELWYQKTKQLMEFVCNGKPVDGISQDINIIHKQQLQLLIDQIKSSILFETVTKVCKLELSETIIVSLLLFGLFNYQMKSVELYFWVSNYEPVSSIIKEFLNMCNEELVQKKELLETVNYLSYQFAANLDTLQ